MSFWYFVFWIGLAILFYSYIGYGIVLYIVLRIKRLLFGRPRTSEHAFLPDVTLLIAAYNEEDFIAEKIHNSLALEYPEHKLQIVIVTDGSTDNTNNIIRQYPRVQLLHDPQRNGKAAAVNRAMQYINTPFVVCCDANTVLNREAVYHLVQHFANDNVGAVAGEKKVIAADTEGQGEGMYWKYESLLKKWDAELYSVMGAAGELFAIRTSLYEPISPDTILDDFMISFHINMKGKKVMYEPKAYAMESSSASLTEEHKRKVRISAGGFQSILRLLPLLNFFRYPRITWQYVSHRVLRWTLAPLSLPLTLIANILLVIGRAGYIYDILLVLQAGFYAAAFAGYTLAKRQVKNKYLYIAFYFLFMNMAVFQGFARFIRKRQSGVWERSQRSQMVLEQGQ
ncbi:glycosyltransferase family 2 protein [Chitinophaga pendula]|uniref:glycosyltransferase family 2 protein n=1 Tax=Chitinophaga TaxID=79328 RepID=UPI000BAF2407|nr:MULTISPECIES: glycosyltransferase family 2 protein [Chitinophaga]ASZ13148.1 glycosyl transferase [Chitinophaga sp. MD30]UCJ09227.1 glycosyltransferase family 2 protein [Chitinophaga pendula]